MRLVSYVEIAMPGQQLTRLSTADCHADVLAACRIGHVLDEPFPLPASMAIIAGLSGVLWGVLWYASQGIMGL